MERNAKELGAHAVVDVDLDYEVLGEQNGMLMMSVSGAAVVLDWYERKRTSSRPVACFQHNRVSCE